MQVSIRVFEMGGRGVVSRLSCAVTPTLAPTAMGSARRHSVRNSTNPNEERETSKHDSLGDRASSKLTLDDELFDILYAFGETDVFLGKTDSKDPETDEDGKPLTRQALLERIRQKKEVIGKLRCQAWSMNRKRRTLKLAQKYLEQNESKVSKSHLYMEEMKKRLRLLKRHFSNLKTYLIPWEGKIKKIESHFGSVVSSYFTFLRWIVFVNVIITLIIFAFVVLPEILADAAADEGRQNRTGTRKIIPDHDRVHADKLAVVWHYDGYLRYSPLFYGYYSDDSFLGEKVRYALPLAYFIVTLFIFAYSFFAILRKMAGNARMSKLSGSRAEQYIFNWRVFTGWDYSIGNSETAANTVMAVVIKLRESVADCRVSTTAKFSCLKFSLRVMANIIICGMLAFSIYCISFAVQKSQTAVEQEGNLFTKNQVPSVVSTITHVFPMIFDLIGRIENYHPRTALRAHLTRVLVLYVLNYMTLIVALFDKMDAIRKEPTGSLFRFKRQMGSRNPNIPRPPPFASRTFENRSQMLRFMDVAKQNFEVNRTTRAAKTTPFTVAPQFGPLTVNNPNALLRNGTFDRSFESRRLGPEPLPLYTPPPRKFPPQTTSAVEQHFGGPDFAHTRATPPTTTIPRVRTKPPWQKTKENTELTKPDPTASIQNRIDSPLLGEKIIIDESSNDTLTLPQPAERKSSADDMYGPDICWETIIGQEIVKLVTMDLIVTIISILLIDFLRGLWIRHCASWWCWDIETTFPEYGEFKVAENVLHIINNQGMIWLGLFFAPMLPALNNIKLIIIMYIRGWAVMTCNVPAREIFRASRSSNFYLLILLLWLLLCTLPVGFVIASTKPSRSCGPFARHDHFYTVVTNEIEKRVDHTILSYIRHVASPGVVIPILLFLMLIIYFLVSLVRGLREANTDLQQQLVHERTEEKKKIFELAGGGKKKEAERERDKRKAIQYIPTIEQKRREPWRAYHEMEEPLRASDSSDSEEDDDVESPDVIAKFNAPAVASSTAETVAVMEFHPSLGSLDENVDEEEEELQPARVLPHSVSMTSNSKVRFDSPCGSFDVQSNVIDVATPEEIRMVTSQALREDQELRPEIYRSVGPASSEASNDKNSNGTDNDSNRYKGPDVHTQFQPWPSIDEVKARRDQLMKRSPLAFGKSIPHTSIPATAETASPSSSNSSNSHNNNHPAASTSKIFKESRPPIPQHRKYEQQEQTPEPGCSDDRRSTSPQRRFRISVSPTRRVMTNDLERASPTKRVYIIKQESAAPSSSSLHESKKVSPRAPRVEFGDDDSPRVQT